MIVAVAVCPAAPWLLAGVAPRLAARAADVADAAVAAVATLADVARIAVVLPSPPGRRDPAGQHGTAVDAATGAAHAAGAASPRVSPRVAVARSDRGAGPMLSAAPAVATRLLTLAGVDRPTRVVTASDGALGPPDGVDDPTVRTGLLVLADGAAAHGASAPGREDPRSAELDRRLTEALAAGRPDLLAAATGPDADPSPVDLLARVDGLRVLAGRTGPQPPQQARLLSYAAPFGVGYLVATWRWTTTAGPTVRP